MDVIVTAMADIKRVLSALGEVVVAFWRLDPWLAFWAIALFLLGNWAFIDLVFQIKANVHP